MYSFFSYLSYPTLSFFRLKAYCLIEILQHSRFPWFLMRNLCFFITLTVFFLVYAATDTAYCYALTSLGLAESRILPAAPADTRSRTPLISFCTVQLQTLCAACSLATLCLSRPLIQALGSCPASGAPWSSAMLQSHRRGRVATTTIAVIQNSSSCFGHQTLWIEKLGTATCNKKKTF